jgi:ankyrin repeat protein
MIAAANGELGVVESLLKRADVNEKSATGYTALMVAARYGQVAVVERLLDNDAMVNLTNFDGRTALMFAASRGHVAIVERLIASDADVNLIDSEGYTALMWGASSGGNAAVTERLVACNADINSFEGLPKLCWAAFAGCDTLVEQLIARDGLADGWAALMTASQCGYEAVVEVLLKQGVDINHASPDGWTVLMGAAESARAVVVERLLEHGADIHKVNIDGNTALDITKNHGFKEDSARDVEARYHFSIVERLITNFAESKKLSYKKEMDAESALRAAAEILSTVFEPTRVGRALEDLAADAARETTGRATGEPHPEPSATDQRQPIELEWPTETWDGSPEKGSRKKSAIEAFLRRVWKPWIDTHDVIVTRQVLLSRDKSAAAALKSYLRFQELPSDIRIFTNDELNERLASRPAAFRCGDCPLLHG